MKQSTIRVDTPTPCAEPVTRDLFDRAIDLLVRTSDNPNSRERRRVITAAREVCKGCHALTQCMTVHGPSTEAFGVVAGRTDEERARINGAVSA